MSDAYPVINKKNLNLKNFLFHFNTKKNEILFSDKFK